MPNDPVNQEVAKQICSGVLGKFQAIFSSGWAGANGYQELVREKTVENLLKGRAWRNVPSIGEDPIVQYGVPVINAVIRVIGEPAVSFIETTAEGCPSVQGDVMNSSAILYQPEDATPWVPQSLLGAYHRIWESRLPASLQRMQATVCLLYAGESHVRGDSRPCSRSVPNPKASVRKNIGTFWNAIQRWCYEKAEAVINGILLGRETVHWQTKTRLSELILGTRILLPDLTGLKW